MPRSPASITGGTAAVSHDAAVRSSDGCAGCPGNRKAAWPPICPTRETVRLTAGPSAKRWALVENTSSPSRRKHAACSALISQPWSRCTSSTPCMRAEFENVGGSRKMRSKAGAPPCWSASHCMQSACSSSCAVRREAVELQVDARPVQVGARQVDSQRCRWRRRPPHAGWPRRCSRRGSGSARPWPRRPGAGASADDPGTARYPGSRRGSRGPSARPPPRCGIPRVD